MGLLPDIHADHREIAVSIAPVLDTATAYERLRACELAGADGRELLVHALRDLVPGRIAAVSSFGAESAVLLALIAEIDPALPVIFLETRKHFPETLAYRDQLVSHLGLLDVRDISPTDQAVADTDPTGELWYYDPDACCGMRKVRPLAETLLPFDGWITGRKRFQAATRAVLPFVEQEGPRLKLNPLADWDGPRIQAELVRRNLPTHPLVERGYRSIGCAPCTRSVDFGEDARAGRWSGSAKVECGIHMAGANI